MSKHCDNILEIYTNFAWPFVEHETLSLVPTSDGEHMSLKHIPSDIRNQITADDLGLHAILQSGDSKWLNPVSFQTPSLTACDNLQFQVESIINQSKTT